MINPHWLIGSSDKKTISGIEVILILFRVWKKLMNEKSDSGYNDFDAFSAGYFLGTNSQLREKYLNESKLNEKLEKPVEIKL